MPLEGKLLEAAEDSSARRRNRAVDKSGMIHPSPVLGHRLVQQSRDVHLIFEFQDLILPTLE